MNMPASQAALPLGMRDSRGLPADLFRSMQNAVQPGHRPGEGVVEEELPPAAQGQDVIGSGAGRGGTGWKQAGGKKEQGRAGDPRLRELHEVTRFPVRCPFVAGPGGS